jgi:hypothetical protein
MLGSPEGAKYSIRIARPKKSSKDFAGICVRPSISKGGSGLPTWSACARETSAVSVRAVNVRNRACFKRLLPVSVELIET